MNGDTRRASVYLSNMRHCEKVPFIKEIERHPVLWDANHEKYYVRYWKAAAWENIAYKLQTSEAKLKAIWKNLRNIFQRELRKNYSRSTSVYRGKWKYFQTMSFLIVKGDDNDNDEGDEYPIEFVEENDFEDQNGEEMYTDDDDYNCTNSDNCPIASDQEIDPVESITDADVRREENNTDSIKENGNLIYDVMFLKSLAPFFKQLVPMRKLIMRSKIQDLLLKEIADQNASNSSET